MSFERERHIRIRAKKQLNPELASIGSNRKKHKGKQKKKNYCEQEAREKASREKANVLNRKQQWISDTAPTP